LIAGGGAWSEVYSLPVRGFSIPNCQALFHTEKERTLISLKRYLDMEVPAPPANGPKSDDLLSAVVECYQSALLAMGSSGTQACPGVSSDLLKKLAKLGNQLPNELTPAGVRKTEKQVEEQLQEWGGKSAEYFKAKADEVKELLLVLARTAQSLGERDQRYATQFTQFTTRLKTIANLEDLTQVRASLVQGAAELKTYVDRMAQDSRESLAQLQAEVSTYETKLKAAEELALKDSLTGLANRRNTEERIEWRIAYQRAFCVLMVDLNRFKQINDTYGHSAGDSLLKQFSQELQSNLRSSDVAGRWGGDEFVVVLDCDLAGANCQTERMRKWVFGDYTVKQPAGAGEVKVPLDASIGVAQWQQGETMEKLIERADTAMYEDKRQMQKKKAAKA
jgi:diguanylate cyclase (GGDEF)-like protein